MRISLAHDIDLESDRPSHEDRHIRSRVAVRWEQGRSAGPPKRQRRLELIHILSLSPFCPQLQVHLQISQTNILEKKRERAQAHQYDAYPRPVIPSGIATHGFE